MISRSQPQQRLVRRAAFTLIEIITVLAIIVVIMGITIKVFTFTPSVDAGARAVSKQLFLARQYAISRRAKIAVLFPNENVTPSSAYTNYRGYSRHAVRVCEVEGTGPTYTFKRHIPGTEWVFLPKGQELRLFDLTTGAYSWTPTATNGISTVDGVVFLEAGGTTFNGLPAIIYDSNGSLVKPIQDVTVVIRNDRNASSLEKNNSTLDNDLAFTDKEAKAVELIVRGLTGRVDYQVKTGKIE